MKTLKCDLCETTVHGETFEQWLQNHNSSQCMQEKVLPFLKSIKTSITLFFGWRSIFVKTQGFSTSSRTDNVSVSFVIYI